MPSVLHEHYIGHIVIVSHLYSDTGTITIISPCLEFKNNTKKGTCSKNVRQFF